MKFSGFFFKYCIVMIDPDGLTISTVQYSKPFTLPGASEDMARIWLRLSPKEAGLKI